MIEQMYTVQPQTSFVRWTNVQSLQPREAAVVACIDLGCMGTIWRLVGSRPSGLLDMLGEDIAKFSKNSKISDSQNYLGVYTMKNIAK